MEPKAEAISLVQGHLMQIIRRLFCSLVSNLVQGWVITPLDKRQRWPSTFAKHFVHLCKDKVFENPTGSEG